MKTIVASELRRYCITPAEVNRREKYRTAHNPRPGLLFWAGKGGKSPVPPRYCTRVTLTLP
jgi:hypothetical protein